MREGARLNAASMPRRRLVLDLGLVGHAGQRTGMVMDHPPATVGADEQIAGDQMLIGETLIAANQPDIAEDRGLGRDGGQRR